MGRPVRLAHIADSHIDATNDLAGTEAALLEFCYQAKAAGVDAILHAGDVYERASSPSERLVAASFVAIASTVAPVFLVRGNHDAPRDIELLQQIRGVHPIHCFERPGFVRWYSQEPERSLVVWGLPWIERSAQITGEQDIRALFAHARATVAEAVRNGDSACVLAHALVEGSTVASGQRLTGCGLRLGPHDLFEIGAPYVALGHVHKGQEWLAYGRAVVYSGSTTRLDHGEPEPKGWRLVEIEGARLISQEFVALPVPGRYTVELDDLALAEGGLAEPVADAHVRVIVKVPRARAAHLDRHAVEQWLLAKGARSAQVELDVIDAVGSERAPELAAAATLWARVALWLRDFSGESIDAARLAELEAKVGTLEGLQGEAV